MKYEMPARARSPPPTLSLSLSRSLALVKRKRTPFRCNQNPAELHSKDTWVGNLKENYNN